MTYNEIIEKLYNAKSYDEHHGKNGKWTYDILIESLNDVIPYLEKLNNSYCLKDYDN